MPETPIPTAFQQVVVNTSDAGTILDYFASQDTTRQEDARTYDEYRFNHGTEYLTPLPGERWVDFNDRQHLAIDWIDFYLSILGQTYAWGEGPTRIWDFEPGYPMLESFWRMYQGEEPDNDDGFNDEVERQDLNTIMVSADKETQWGGTTLCKMHYVGPNRPPVPVVLRPWQFEVIQSSESPFKLSAVKVLLNNRASNTLSTDGSRTYDKDVTHVYEIWTDTMYCQIDQNYTRIVPEQPNPYGTIPFLRFADDPTFADFWCPGKAKRIVYASKVINSLMTELVDLMMHLYGQPVIVGEVTNHGKDKKLFVGKSVAINCEIGGGFQRVSSGAQIEDFIKGKNEILGDLALSLGLSPGDFLLEFYKKRDTSGVSIVAAQQSPTGRREKALKKWARYEQRMIQLAALVQATHTGVDRKAILPRKFTVVFPTLPKTTQSAQEIETAQEFELRTGLKPRWMIAMERNPALSEEQARAQVTEADADQKESSSEIYAQLAKLKFQLEAALQTRPQLLKKIDPDTTDSQAIADTAAALEERSATIQILSTEGDNNAGQQ